MFKYALNLVLVLLGFSVGSVNALGIGNIEAETALNEPLRATISLRDTSGVRADEISVSLAPIAEFQATGIDYTSLLNGLQFSVVADDANSPESILVRSSVPVREPYVNFLLSVRWPNGRLLKEYTILLDPVFGDSNLVSSSVPIAQQISTGRNSSVTRQQGSGTEPPQSRLGSASDAPGTITVQPNATMWEIAKEVTPKGVSVHQTMHAIKAQNPEAFINNNINRVKAGYILQIPAANDINSISPQVAARATKTDYDTWVGSKTSSSQASQVVSSSIEGELTLAAANNNSQNDTVALEKISSLESENAELSDRLQSLEKQLSDMNRLIELKNAQLAAVQQVSAEVNEQNAADSAIEESTAVAEVADEKAVDAVEGVAQTGEAAQFEVMKGAMPPVLEPEQALWMNPLVQLSVLGSILLALIIAIILNGRKSKAQTVELEDVGIILDSDKGSSDDDDDLEDIIELPETTAQQTGGDLSAEYGDMSYAEAKASIEQKLETQAHRADLQLYLLQLAAAADDEATFVGHFRAFEAIGKSEDVAKAKNILTAVKGDQRWLEPEPDMAATMIQMPGEELAEEDGDEFFKDIVHEAELTDEIAALLEASEGTTSLDQADIDEMDFDGLGEADVDSATDDVAFDGSDDTLEFDGGALTSSDTDTETEETEETQDDSDFSMDDDDDGLDFDLGDLDIAAEAKAEPEPEAADDGDLDFAATLESNVDDFNETMVIPPDEAEAESEETSDGDLDFDLGLDDDDTGSSADLDDLLADSEEVSATRDDDESSDLDSLFDDLSFDDETGVGVSDPSEEEVVTQEEPLKTEPEDDDLSSLLEGLDLSEPEESAEPVAQEGDIIDLSDFLDSSDDATPALEDELEDDFEELESGSDDFDDLDDLSSLLDSDGDGEVDADEEMNTKLGMAEAFIEMGDVQAAKEALNEVVHDGEAQHREAARSLLAKLGE